MKVFVATLLICSSAFASQDVADSKQAISTAASAAELAIGVAKAALISSCVTPQALTECNPTTSMLVTIGGDVLSTLTSKAVKGVAGPIAGGAISAASCLAIRCDVAKTIKTTCGTTCESGCGTDSACVSNCTASLSTDMLSYSNIYRGTQKGYIGCTSPGKTAAKAQQAKCQSICAGMVLALATLETIVTGINPSVDKIEEQTSTSNGPASTASNTNGSHYQAGNSTNNNNVDATDLGYEKRFSNNASVSDSSAATADTGTAATSSKGTLAGMSSAGGASSGENASSGTPNALVTGSDITSSGGANRASAAASLASGSNNRKTRLQGLDRSKAAKDAAYMDQTQDLFGQVSAIHSSYYRSGVIGVKDSESKTISKKRGR